MNTSYLARGLMFGTILISAFTLMHIYVFWRAASVPFVDRLVPRKILIGVGVILWAIFLFGRVIGHGGTGVLAGTFEFLGMNWMAVLFLIFIPLLAIDLTTLFGFLIPKLSASLRGWAFLVGVALSLIAIFQGLRPPVIEKYEVSLPGLPDAMDGTVLVALSDMHLGSQLGERWLAARIAQVKAQRPDIVVLLGDIFEGHGPPEEQLIATLKQLSAPLGIWAVPGNHEFHGSGDLSLFDEVSFKLLRNGWAEVRPGLILAGVDDLTSGRLNGQGGDPISQALIGRPPGATILLSHTPWQTGSAAKAGAGLMLSGHTHGGQIWPFGYLVRSRYPLLEGRYEVDGMTVIVCRGTGTWGTRMRLWRPSEILHVTLRGKGK
ncbi:MAG: metallophosphoesterase [Pseudomonadota bacterium]